MSTSTISISDPAAFARLGEFIRDIRVAMLTTVGGDGGLRSRPMEMCELTPEGVVWFLADEYSALVREIADEHQVGLSFVDCKRQHYVSASGTATLEHNRTKMRELWRPALAAYFPGGLDDPRLALLRIQIESGEYWDASESRVVQLYAFARALMTGEPARRGDHRHVDLQDFQR